MGIACESVSVVNRVVLQHMSINILDGLSPPSDSMMMQRRKSLQKGQSLQLNRLNNNIKDLSTPHIDQTRSDQSPHHNKSTRVLTSVQFVYNYQSVWTIRLSFDL